MGSAWSTDEAEGSGERDWLRSQFLVASALRRLLIFTQRQRTLPHYPRVLRRSCGSGTDATIEQWRIQRVLSGLKPSLAVAASGCGSRTPPAPPGTKRAQTLPPNEQHISMLLY